MFNVTIADELGDESIEEFGEVFSEALMELRDEGKIAGTNVTDTEGFDWPFSALWQDCLKVRSWSNWACRQIQISVT